MKNKFFNHRKRIKRKIENIYQKLFSYPRLKYKKNLINKYWQIRRKDFKKIKPNDFQIERAKLFSLLIEDKNSLLFDIGSGDAAQLIAIRNICPNLKIIGSDKDKFSCELIKKANFNFHYFNEKESIKSTLNKYCPKYITLFEVIEHMYAPEEFLLELLENKRIQKVFFSIPNSGFFMHRLRYMLGRFPLQWIVNPNEHIRFWTLKDLIWWLDYLELINKSEIIPYKGIPILNKIFPNLFAEGSFIMIKNGN